jgi:hypothetical protein
VNPVNELEREASIITNYLVGKPCTGELVKRYVDANIKQAIQVGPEEEQLWKNALRGVYWMSCIDSGLALVRPKSQIRRKIFVMLAILEASVDYCDDFLPRTRSKVQVLFLLAVQGVKAVFFATIGLILIKIF